MVDIKALEHKYIFSKYSRNLIKNIILTIFRRVAWNYLSNCFQWFETWNLKFRLTSENEVFYISEILEDNYSSCSMLKIFPKYLNFENILKKCIHVPGPLYNNRIVAYSGTSLKWTLTGQKFFSALERCLPWRGLN